MRVLLCLVLADDVRVEPRWKMKVMSGRREGMQAETTPMETSVAVQIAALTYVPGCS